jgi:UDP-N-acetylmuramoyl-tripeptide--D-alanyl-D-alanine ligase
MKALTLSTVIELCGGTLRHGDDHVTVNGITTDSRKARAGEVFVALVGEKFDAHDFVPQVAQAGASAVIVSRIDPSWTTLPCAVIEVGETLLALQRLAHGYRLLHQPKVVGITGSNGKTSTKDLTLAVLSSAFQTFATRGNLNNHIGVPLSLLSLEAHHDCAVIEMGMNHPGEIKVLADIAEPNAAIITNIGLAHIEYMGTRDAIALEKGTLAEAVPASGFVVLNANDEYTPSIRSRCRAQVLTAGIDAGDVSATDLQADAEGTAFNLSFRGEKFPAFLPIPGEHMVGNAALAAAAAWRLGVQPEQIIAALRAVKLTGGRLETKTISGVTFLDDSYNANPDSMKAGLRTLVGLQGSGRRIAVLGRMGELGEHAVPEHRSLGEYAAGLRLDGLYTVGDEAALISEAAAAFAPSIVTRNFDTHEACAAHLKQHLMSGDIVLLKGSRSAGMEKVLSHFQTT